MNQIWQHYDTFIEQSKLPQDAVSFLQDSAKSVRTLEEQFLNLLEEYKDGNYSAKKVEEQVMQLAGTMQIPFQTLWFILFVCASLETLEKYRERGYADDFYWDMAYDLISKVYECHRMYGIWGIFVAFWFEHFFKLEIFRLGRLHFERMRFEGEEPVEVGDFVVKKGTLMYGVHIPSDGGPFTKERREESYRLAKKFFRDELVQEAKRNPDSNMGHPFILFCHSWLLYPDNKKAFPSAKNIHSFIDEWFIYHKADDEKLQDAWRIFGKRYEGDISIFPQETSLQKEYVQWITNGGKLGFGAGFQIR